MKILKNDRKDNTVTLEVETEASQFEQAKEKALVQAAKEIKLPGFRPGKAPKNMVEQAVNPEYVANQAVQDLISSLYPQIITETKIDPVDYPNIEIVSQKEGQPFVFKIKVDVYPEVKLGKYKGLKAEKKKVAVTEEDLVKVLGNFQERIAQVGPDGKKNLAPIDDEFAKKISRFSTLAELKEEMRETMLKERQAEAESEVKNQLVALISNDAKVEIPNGMVEREVNLMLDELRMSLSRSGLTLEDYLKGMKKEEQAMREELKKSAEIRVKGKVVLRALAEKEQLTISPEELEEEFKKIAQETGEKIEDLKKRIDSEGKKYIEDYMLRAKALDLALEKAKIEEVEAKVEKEKPKEEAKEEEK